MARGSVDFQRIVTIYGNVIIKANFIITLAASVSVTAHFLRFLDNDAATHYLWNNTGSSEETGTILFDLGNVKLIRTINVFFSLDNSGTPTKNNLIIDHSEDNVIFTELSSDNYTGTTEKLFNKSFGDAKFRYLRFRSITNPGTTSQARFHTVQVFE